MPTELKKTNYKWISALLGVNALLFIVGAYASVLADPAAIKRLVGGLVSAGGVAALLILLNGVVGPEMKARLIYLRWQDPLPGSRAFTELAASDPRIDLDRLKKKSGPIPDDARSQNALWYQYYKPLANQPSVLDAHRGYLLGRDYTCFAMAQACLLGPLALVLFKSTAWALAFSVFLLAQLAISWVSAAHYGRRLVTNVLALKAASLK